MKEFIAVSDNVLNLKGVGEEILIDSDGNVIAKFYNGNLQCDNYHRANVFEDTLPSAA